MDLERTSEKLEEYIIPDPAYPVGQGDLLLSRDLHGGEILSVCIVITADCDIAHGKFGSQLACLRVISLRNYLKTIWAERKLSRVVNAETRKIGERFDKWHRTTNANAQPLSPEAISSWVRNRQPADICGELQVPASELKNAATTVTIFQDALLALDLCEPADAFAGLVAFRAAISGKTKIDCRKEIVRQAQGEGLPDDIFLLPAVPQLEDGPAVVLLRELIGIPIELVSFRATDATTNDHFLRIGALRSTFKYAISQAFGNLYTRIGLPESYENRRKAAIEQIASFDWN